MASQKLTEYELKRLENIKRNTEMVAALELHSKAANLSAARKRQRRKSSPVMKPKTENLRRSLRRRGMPPDSKGLVDFNKPFSMIDVFNGDEPESNQVLVDTILSISKKTQVKDGFDNVNLSEKRTYGLVDTEKSDAWLESLDLKPENVAKVLSRWINVVKFFPSSSMRMIAAGNRFGSIAFWNVDSNDENEDGRVYRYRPHTGSISGILIHQHSMSKIYSSSYNGFIRLMDAEKEVFELVHSCDDGAVCSLSQQPNDSASLYFADDRGGLNVWDIRSGKASKNWMLHEYRMINTISFNSQNPNIMATGSSDGTACIWDLRSMSTHKPKNLKTVSHSRAVHSAYFSPSGSSLATTSLDNHVGVISGVNFEDTSMIYHDNVHFTFSCRGIWGWDDSYIFIGSKKNGVDVISPAQRSIVRTLQSPQMPSPCRFDSHPYEVGLLAGATSYGHVYLWTPC